MLTLTVGKPERLEVSKTDDWDLIVVCYQLYCKILNMNEGQKDRLKQELYRYSDGFGIKGFLPDGCYDWSGVRDSTPKALKEMADAVRLWLDYRQVRFLTVVKER